MKILMIGAFCFKTLDTGGQPVKSRELYWALCKKYGNNSVEYIETSNWRRNPFKLFINCFRKSIRSDIIVMMPAHNGVRVFSKILVFVKKMLKKQIYYDVIGGWLVELVNSNHRLEKQLKKFDCLFVETTFMKDKLTEKGIKCEVVPNFKNLSSVNLNKCCYVLEEPYKICIFSRVTEMKGIGEAVNAIGFINSEKVIYKLDIYGPIDPEYKDTFNSILEKNLSFVEYKGIVSPSKSVDCLKEYYFLLFPTKFYTEGIPGTIIDAYFSGIPVVSSKWLNFDDVIENGKTGYGYTFNDTDDMIEVLLFLSKSPSIVYDMKKNCVDKANTFSPEYAINILDHYFSKKRG